jgi:hypothetical protein
MAVLALHPPLRPLLSHGHGHGVNPRDAGPLELFGERESMGPWAMCNTSGERGAASYISCLN